MPDPTSIYSRHKLYRIYFDSDKWLYFSNLKTATLYVNQCAVDCNILMIQYFDFFLTLRNLSNELFLYYGNDKIFEDLDFYEKRARAYYQQGPGWHSWGGPFIIVTATGSHIKKIAKEVQKVCVRRRLDVPMKKAAAIIAAIDNGLYAIEIKAVGTIPQT